MHMGMGVLLHSLEGIILEACMCLLGAHKIDFVAGPGTKKPEQNWKCSTCKPMSLDCAGFFFLQFDTV